jgi:competence protein ComEC
VLTLCAAASAAGAVVSPGLALPFLWFCHPLAWLLLRVNDLFAAPDLAVIGIASPGLLGLCASYLGLALALAGGRRSRWAGAALALAGLVGPDLTRARLAARRGLLEVVFLSVGQGDATMLRLPDGAALLVDGGGDPQGRYDPGARDVLPFLRDAGIRRPWLAVLSHPHADHLLGLASVGAAMPPGAFVSAGRSADDETGAAALARLPPPRVLRRGALLERAGVRLRVLGPPPGVDEWSQNDASLVLRVEHGTVAFLLLGDVEAEGETALLAGGEPVHADVVKVAHHGARTSSTPALVEAVRPAVAVLSLARRNAFGFPAPEVVERWRRAGAVIARTDEGAVRFLSDGTRVWRAPAGGAIDAWAMWNDRTPGTGAPDPPPAEVAPD